MKQTTKTRRFIALALTLMLLVGVLAGCGGNTSGSADKDGLVLALSNPMETVDPDYTQAVTTLGVLYNVYDFLFKSDLNSGTLYQSLCDSYTVSDDMLTYVLSIKQGVKFHNGDEVTAEDVAFSINRAIASPLAGISGLGEASATGDYEVTLTSTVPSASALFNLSYAPILNKNIVEEAGDSFGSVLCDAGSGPYCLTSYDANVGVTLEAFPDYFGDKASIKNVEYKVITDASSALIAFESGDLDWVQCPITNWPQYIDTNDYSTEVMTDLTTVMLCVAPYVEPLMDLNVRLAIGYALNKEEIINGAVDGYGAATDYVIEPGMNAGAPENSITYNYNLDKAKECLKAAGIEGEYNCGDILVNAGSVYEKAAQVIQQELAEIGIIVGIDRCDQATFFNRMLSGEFSLMCLGCPNTGDMDQLRLYTLPPFFDYSGIITSEEVTAKFDAADANMDDTARREAMAEVVDDYMSTGTYFPIFHSQMAYMWNPELNVVNAPNPLRDIYKWSWNQ